MDDSSRDRLASAIRSLDEFDAFVADLWTALGWTDDSRGGVVDDDATTPDRTTDLLVTRDQGDDENYLVRVLTDGRDVRGNDVRRLLDDATAREDLSGGAVVTAGRITDEASNVPGTDHLELLGIDDIVSLVRDRDVVDPVLDHASTAGDDGPGADFGDVDADPDAAFEASSGTPESADPENRPAVFSEVTWRVGTGPVADLPADERADHVKGVVEHAFGDTVTEESLLDPPSEAFSYPLADYLQTREQPAFLFEEPARGVTLENRGIAESPDDSGATVHLVTNERILSVVAREDDDFTLNVPLSAVRDVEDRPALFDGEVVVHLDEDVLRLPIHHGLASDVVDSAVTYLDRGPHPWKGAEVARGTISNPATFGDAADAE